MVKNKQNIAILIVLIFGFSLLYFGTDGFQAFTAEKARVNNLMKDHPIFPEVTLEDSEGAKYSFSKFEGKYVLMTFLYTGCTDVCPQLEYNLAQVHDLIPSQYVGEKIEFLSISFDPTRDTPETLKKYAQYFNTDSTAWKIARISNEEELTSLLNEFGIIVIPDDYGNFQHNSAFYLVDPNGILIEVLDYKKVEEAATIVTTILEEKVGRN
ncbi:protein SCO1/2 [Ureibacillus xyleni]|uniref:Protein SCO1/2 n=1 Tax=Ureibacillus xyleni TaxID=614648 RepID=A0A285RXV5_9BACL|nr:SCO family protein [Ureibacillus xyleni]SOB99381.1 protein SCO1/2 [Ureibacillus xyleni]